MRSRLLRLRDYKSNRLSLLRRIFRILRGLSQLERSSTRHCWMRLLLLRYRCYRRRALRILPIQHGLCRPWSYFLCGLFWSLLRRRPYGRSLPRVWREGSSCGPSRAYRILPGLYRSASSRTGLFGRLLHRLRVAAYLRSGYERFPICRGLAR